MSLFRCVSWFSAVLCAPAAVMVFVSASRAAEVGVRSIVPVTCAVMVIRSSLSTLHPLLQIVATVQTNCNATHDLTFRYSTAAVTRPERLVVTFGGVISNLSAPGERSFTALAPTNSAKELRIRYDGGTLAEKRLLRDGWRIVVSAR